MVAAADWMAILRDVRIVANGGRAAVALPVFYARDRNVKPTIVLIISCGLLLCRPGDYYDHRLRHDAEFRQVIPC